MTSRYANDGTRVVLAAPSGGVTAGDFVLVGGFFGVAMGTALVGEDFVLAVGGTYTAAPKVAGTAWTAGDLVSWVTGSSAFGVSTTLDVQAVVLADALSAATTATVRLLDAPMDNPARLTAVETLAGTTIGGRLDTLEGDQTVVILGAAAVAVTGTATETITQTATIPAGALEAGDTLVITGGQVATSTTGTETAIGRIRIGGLTGPVVSRTNAQDVADADEAGMFGVVNVETLGIATASAVSMTGYGAWSTAGTVFGSVVLASDALDTTAEITVVSTVEASSTGESIIGHGLKITRLRKAA